MAATDDLSPLAREIHNEIRAERSRRHLTQQQVFTAAGMSKSAYIKLENSQRGGTTEQLAAIASALGVPLSVLVARAEERLASLETDEA